MQQETQPVRSLLNARQVQDILHIDRSTVYRMAETGRLPAIRVGKQWRFPADEILAVVSDIPGRHEPAHETPTPVDPAKADAVIGVAAELLGVMMVVTDMDGEPITSIANPCPWFVEHTDDPAVMAACIEEWRQLADDDHFEPEFDLGEAGFQCARAFIRSGRELTGMVLAGGVSPTGVADPALYDLTDEQRERVLHALPRIAVAITRSAPAGDGAPTKERT
jgi:excisionase family DNA binding protein